MQINDSPINAFGGYTWQMLQQPHIPCKHARWWNLVKKNLRTIEGYILKKICRTIFSGFQIVIPVFYHSFSVGNFFFVNLSFFFLIICPVGLRSKSSKFGLGKKYIGLLIIDQRKRIT